MDIIMPEMTGLEALREILTLDPAARILVCTVIDQEALITEAIQAGAKGFVLKPFTISHLRDAVRELVERNPGK